MFQNHCGSSHVHSWTLPAAVCALACTFAPAFAVEDTNTPGDGRWEINIESSGERTSGGWTYGTPNTDINYGWGDRLQLVLGASRVTVHDRNQEPKSGLAAGLVGFKWRFIDQEEHGFALSIFPLYSWNLSPSSERRGVVAPGRSLYLPFIAGVESGRFGFFAEGGRNFVEGDRDEWSLGGKLTYRCAETVECRVEAQQTLSPSASRQTLVLTGFKWSLNDSLILKGAVGRDVGRHNDGRRDLILQLGVQILR